MRDLKPLECAFTVTKSILCGRKETTSLWWGESALYQTGIEVLEVASS